jgi:hypothetical protein
MINQHYDINKASQGTILNFDNQNIVSSKSAKNFNNLRNQTEQQQSFSAMSTSILETEQEEP